MPVIPSFSAFAPTPNLASSYLGGANLALDEQRLAQAAAQASAHLQMQRERLAQDAVQNEMEMASRERVSMADNLRRQQEMEIEKAYKTNVLGLRSQGMKQQEQKFQMEAIAAAQKMQQQRAYQSQMLGFREQEVGFKAQALKNSNRRAAHVPEMINVGGQDLISVGPTKWQFRNDPAERIPNAASGARISSLTSQLKDVSKEIAEPSRMRMKSDTNYIPSLIQRRDQLRSVLDRATMDAPMPSSVTGTNSVQSATNNASRFKIIKRIAGDK